MFSSIISSAAISSASSFTSATIAANMAARNFVTSTDNSIYSFLTMNMKIIQVILQYRRWKIKKRGIRLKCC